MNIIQTEYSFKEVFYTLEQAVQDSIDAGHHEICLLDRTTFGFVKFERLCGRTIMPIFGLRIHMTDKTIKGKGKWESFEKCEEIFLIAKNQKGISDLLKIYSLSTKQKYYFNRIYPIDILGMDFIVISDLFPGDYKKDEICIPFAKYSKPEDVNTYQCISSSRGYSAKEEHFLTDVELLKYFTRKQIKAKNDLANKVDAAFITISGMIEYNGKKKFDLECWKGLDHLGLSNKEEYVARLEHEIKMIRSKKFQDYFMIVAEMILDAKKNMLVGPGRGSSGGSLVCYCLGITNIDPIKFGLIFERFIDTNRWDLPDIDSDYPDNKRQMVIENIAKRYKSVYPLGVVSRYKPRTILNEFAKAYELPVYELSAVKDVIVTRNSGDERANNCLEDTLAETFEGQNLINEHPYMASGIPAENHARHSGKHAAGIIVTDDDITKYAAIDHVSGTLCIEGYDAEFIGLLKIDCLGLRTLSVIENCLRLSEVHIGDIYNINLEDPAVLAVFATDDLADIFQFDGDTVNRINKKIEVTCFNDLATITALGRPGALDSGGTKRFIDIEKGEETITSYGEVYDRITADTNGIVIFQEQAMFLLREYGNLPWGDVNDLRKIIGKSKGTTAFLKYKEVFLKGAIDNSDSEEEAEIVWEAIESQGKYAFNKAHSIAYSMISYWCAYCKVKYPLNFLAANLNNAKDDKHGLKMLRQYVTKYKIDYVAVDTEISEVGWTIQDGKLIGGFTNIDGIGEKKAEAIIKKRTNNIPLTKAIAKKLENPVTPFDTLYPITQICERFYKMVGVTLICDIKPAEDIGIVGRVLEIEMKDRNAPAAVAKRHGEKVKEDQFFISMIVEDDTGSIRAMIPPFCMDDMNGQRIMEEEQVKKGDLVSIRGTVRKDWPSISIKQLTPLKLKLKKEGVENGEKK